MEPPDHAMRTPALALAVYKTPPMPSVDGTTSLGAILVETYTGGVRHGTSNRRRFREQAFSSE